MDALDIKLNEAFPGKVVRKDLLHEIKRAVNVPSFVLEFLLSRYCASEDPEEIEEGKKAVPSFGRRKDHRNSVRIGPGSVHRHLPACAAPHQTPMGCGKTEKERINRQQSLLPREKAFNVSVFRPIGSL